MVYKTSFNKINGYFSLFPQLKIDHNYHPYIVENLEKGYSDDVKYNILYVSKFFGVLEFYILVLYKSRIFLINIYYVDNL